ncbi:MAG TPA: class I SAM-dependent methyltransferase [Acidimicrobiales bacterium]|nr:class I SAM-dependent methyltransferase [Acidimicrobiales bacterium]
MLTVDYDRLGLRAGDRLLDLGCGGGRHAFEAYRRGARVVALDYAYDELPEVLGLVGAMRETGEGTETSSGVAVNGDACNLGFADDSFDRIIASEVFEHVPDDAAAFAELTRVLRPGGVMAVTVPSWFPEKICWALSDEYHAPFVEGGHVRVYGEATLRSRMRDAGLEPQGSHRAHALHSPYWWLRCAVGPTNDDHPLVRAYHQLLVWDLSGTPVVSNVTRTTEHLLNPVLGKSLVVYARKPPRRTAARHDHGRDGSGTLNDQDKARIGA